MGVSVFQYDSSASQEAEPGESSADAESCYDSRWGARGRLRRTFRKRDGIALIVSNVVGVGIFTTPALVANLVPNPTAILALWIVGGGLALAGASSYAKLANLWPSAGGEYVYLSKTYGPGAGFLSGWTSLIAGFSGSVAASAVAVVLFAGQYFPGLASDRALASLDFFGLSVNVTVHTGCSFADRAFCRVAHFQSHVRQDYPECSCRSAGRDGRRLRQPWIRQRKRLLVALPFV